MKYNLSKIMFKAWEIYRKVKNICFGEALHRAWLSAKSKETNAKRIEEGKAAVVVGVEGDSTREVEEMREMMMKKMMEEGIDEDLLDD